MSQSQTSPDVESKTPLSAFTVLENGVPQEINLFEEGDVPVSEGIIIDNSANMRDKRETVLGVALALVGESNPQDEVFIVNFNDEAFNATREGLHQRHQRDGGGPDTHGFTGRLGYA